MTAPAKPIIDTRKIVDQLAESGVPAEQAKVHASVIADAIQMQSNQFHAGFVNKEELREELRPIHAAIAELQTAVAELKRAVAELQRTVAELQRTVAVLDAKLDSKVLELNAKIDMVKMELYAMIEARIAQFRRDIRRDMAVAALLQIAALSGIMFGLIH